LPFYPLPDLPQLAPQTSTPQSPLPDLPVTLSQIFAFLQVTGRSGSGDRGAEDRGAEDWGAEDRGAPENYR